MFNLFLGLFVGGHGFNQRNLTNYSGSPFVACDLKSWFTASLIAGKVGKEGYA